MRQVFTITKVGKVAGCMVTEGLVKRGAGVRVLREGVVIHNGELSQLKRFKDDVREVARGYECGLSLRQLPRPAGRRRGRMLRDRAGPGLKKPAKAAAPKRGPTQRQLRVAEEIRHVLAGVFARREFRDPGAGGRRTSP